MAEGSLTFNTDGSYSFDPGSAFDDLAPGATRDVSFTYTATDNNGGVSNVGHGDHHRDRHQRSAGGRGRQSGTDEDTCCHGNVPVPTDMDGTHRANGYRLVANVAEGSLTSTTTAATALIRAVPSMTWRRARPGT